jgi:hypothetical protein
MFATVKVQTGLYNLLSSYAAYSHTPYNKLKQRIYQLWQGGNLYLLRASSSPPPHTPPHPTPLINNLAHLHLGKVDAHPTDAAAETAAACALRQEIEAVEQHLGELRARQDILQDRP